MDEDDFLALSGIQHFLFCRRQWALIHIDSQWAENQKTVEGKLMHRRAHDNSISEKRGDTIVVRGLKVSSNILGIIGQCDIVEFRKSDEGVPIANYDGLWIPYPVEYKRGGSKTNRCDEAQLCAQAMCLEEMLCTDIKEGALFYGEQQKRHVVLFSPSLRKIVTDTIDEMRKMYARGIIPRNTLNERCDSCSLNSVCLPKMSNIRSVDTYIKESLCDDY